MLYPVLKYPVKGQTGQNRHGATRACGWHGWHLETGQVRPAVSAAFEDSGSFGVGVHPAAGWELFGSIQVQKGVLKSHDPKKKEGSTQ